MSASGGGPEGATTLLHFLVDVSDILYFFLFRGGGQGGGVEGKHV